MSVTAENTEVTCPSCSGGYTTNGNGDIVKCNDCGGEGLKRK